MFCSIVWVAHIVPELHANGTSWSIATTVDRGGGSAVLYQKAFAGSLTRPGTDWCTLDVSLLDFAVLQSAGIYQGTQRSCQKEK